MYEKLFALKNWAYELERNGTKVNGSLNFHVNIKSVNDHTSN